MPLGPYIVIGVFILTALFLLIAAVIPKLKKYQIIIKQVPHKKRRVRRKKKR